MSERYIELQAAFVAEHGIAVGTQVRITEAAESGQAGWGNTWEDLMNYAIGGVGVVTRISPESGINVKIKGYSSWEYPYFVLEVIE